ncbi:uracil-DNA glycosylase family protein [Pseudaestuariivita sp.]|uniref:uracil-DNA glycosylase family protein n=1 Tax=Pseudaestuariivita sp. TaxID=2211669 RepID=UPI004058BD6F
MSGPARGLPPSNAASLEGRIAAEYALRVAAHPNAGLGWRLLYSPARVLGGADVAFIGLNPGGGKEAIASPEFSCETGSAYRAEVECWGKSSRLQEQVLALFDRLGVAPEDVLAGNLIPFRSRSEASLTEQPEARAFGEKLWREILVRASPRLVVTMGRTTHISIRDVLGVTAAARHPVGWGRVSALRGVFPGGTWIGLPHLSRFSIMTRPSSADALNSLFAGICRA